MPKTNISTTPTRALIINPECAGGKQMGDKLETIGIEVQHLSESKLISFSLENISYLAWFSNNVEESVKIYNEIISSNTIGAKILFCISLDEEVQSRQEIETRTRQIIGQINQINQSSLKKNLDLRVVLYQGFWETNAQNQSISITKIIKNLSQKNINLPENEKLYPLNINLAISKIISIWFDRGHQGKTVYVRGQQFNTKDLTQTLIDNYPHLSDSAHPLWWIIGEGIVGVETINVSDNPVNFINFLNFFVSQGFLPPEPPPPKPADDTTARFETVIASSNQVNNDSNLNNISPSLPLRQVEKASVPKIITAPQPSTKPSRSGRLIKPHPSPQLKRKKIILLALILFVLGTILAPLGAFFLFLTLANNTSSNSEASTFETNQKNIDISSNYLNSVSDWALVFPPIYKLRTQLDKLKNSATERILIARAESELVAAAKLMVTADQGNPFIPLQQAKHTLDDLYLSQSTHDSNNSDYKQWVIGARQAADLIPRLLPADKKITLMILLQNNLELRPTGGFVGAVALLTFDHGKLLNVDTRDIYDLDSNLKGLVAPPSELKKYLGESSWYFRDANWSPNFIDTAGTANWFLDKEWGSTADIIVGINLNTIQTILRATGSLTLPDGQIIGADNLMVTAFNHQDVPTAKPDVKKQEFLSLFIKPLLDRVSSMPPDQAIKLLSALGQATENGEITLISTDEPVLRDLIDLGWAGNINIPTCPANFISPCWSDFLYLNEANVGINKANYYLARDIKHAITLGDIQSNHLHTIDYVNQSPSDAWPGGSYKSYIRIYLPPQASNINISLNGETITGSINTYPSTTSYKTLGFFLEIKPQTSASLKIAYSTPSLINYKSYVFGMQKQPGTTPDQFALTLDPPPGRSISQSSSNSQPGSSISISGNFQKNQTLTIEFNP